MLFAMRNLQVRALVNIDAANFSDAPARDLAFYSPRLLRVLPFLYIATAETKPARTSSRTSMP